MQNESVINILCFSDLCFLISPRQGPHGSTRSPSKQYDDESAGVPGCARAADPASEEVDLEKRKRVAIGNKLYTQEIHYDIFMPVYPFLVPCIALPPQPRLLLLHTYKIYTNDTDGQ